MTRAERLAISVPNEILSHISWDSHVWYEDRADIRRGLAWGRRKRVLLAWVQWKMATTLNQRERESLELYFLHNLTYRDVGTLLGVHASTVFRNVRNGIAKLKHEAESDPPPGMGKKGPLK